MEEKDLEEILEIVWISEEKKEKLSVKKLSRIYSNSEILNNLEKRDLITVEDEEIKFTENGREKAKAIIRRHRLAERLMVDILGVNLDNIEENACEFEHVIAPAITESICTLLGHPKVCPHGNPIPEGVCCYEARKNVENILTSLDQIETGNKVKIAYFSCQNHPLLNKLISFGLIPGTKIIVHQKSPSFVIQLENSQLALEKDIASSIIVWK